MKVDELQAMVEELEGVLVCLEDRLAVKAETVKTGRKDEVLAILKTGRVTVAELAKQIGISDRNVSSQLSYLRKDGIAIGTDSKGRKFIES